MTRVLKVKVVHDPDAFPATFLADEDGNPVTIEGANGAVPSTRGQQQRGIVQGGDQSG
jgi:hypothetical protein